MRIANLIEELLASLVQPPSTAPRRRAWAAVETVPGRFQAAVETARTENAKRSFERGWPSDNVEAPRAGTRAKRELEGGPNRRLGGGLLILPQGGAVAVKSEAEGRRRRPRRLR